MHIYSRQTKTVTYTCVRVLAGLSKVITDLLHPVGMPRARSHELPVHVGAAGVPVHSLINIGGSYCLRCEPESIYRSVQAVGHAALVIETSSL